MQCSLSSIEMKMTEKEQQNSLVGIRDNQKPIFILPKPLNQFKFKEDQPEILSETEFDQSFAPRFHNPIIQSPEQNKKKTHKIIRNNYQYDQTTIKGNQQENQNPISNNSILLNLIICLTYLMGSVELRSHDITIFHVVDCIGNGMAFLYLLFKFVSNKAVRSFDEILHIWSIILTVTFIVYRTKTLEDQIFIKVLLIIRSFRILFPFFISNKFINVFSKPLRLINLSKKTIFTSILLLILYGLVCYQLYSGSQGNRCRGQMLPSILDQWKPVDDDLCGSRNCPVNTYCRNPRQIGAITSSQAQIKNQKFNFDSSWNAAISTFFMFTANSWSMISRKYFDVFNASITVPLYIIAFFYYLELMLSLITIFFDYNKSKKDRKQMRNKQKQLQRQKLNLKISQSNVKHQNKYSQKKVIFTQAKSSNQIQDNKYIQQSARKMKQHKIKQVAFGEQQKQSAKKQQLSVKIQGKTIILYILVVLSTIIHIVLASQFGLNPKHIDTDFYNRKVGIIMVIFFIMQFFLLAFIGFQLLGLSQQQEHSPIQQNQGILMLKQTGQQKGINEKQVTFMIFYLQGFIFLTQLFDYLARMAEGKYLLEQTTCLTTLSHFFISLRLYYILLAFSFTQKYNSIQIHLFSCIKAFTATLKYFIIIVLVPCFLGIILHIIKSNSQDGANQLFRSINSFFLLEIHFDNTFALITGVVWILVFEFLITKYIISNVLIASSASYYTNFLRSDNQTNSPKVSIKSSQKLKKSTNIDNQIYKEAQPKQVNQKEEQKNYHQQQKSFLIFSLQNSIRIKLYNLLKDSSYHKKVKARFLWFYLFANIITFIIGEHQSYKIVTTIFQVFLILDVLACSIAFRFSGKYSFTNNEILNFTYVSSMVLGLILVWSEIWYEIVIIIQLTRIFVVAESFQSIKPTVMFIRQNLSIIFTHFLILIPIVFGGTLLNLINLSGKDEQIHLIQKFLLSMKISLSILCEKGNYGKIIQFSNDNNQIKPINLFIQKAISLIFSMTFIYSLAGLLISVHMKQKQINDKQLIGKLDNKTLLQHHKIKQRILSLRPQLDSSVYGSGFFTQLSQSCLLQMLKKSSCAICLLCFLMLNTSFTNNQRIILYYIQLFFLFIEIGCFICQSIGYNGSQPGFVKDILIYLISIPGAYIGFVNPLQYSTEPYQLKYMMLSLNALSICRLFNALKYIEFSKNIYRYVMQKFNRTIHGFCLLQLIMWGLGLYMYEMSKHNISITECMFYVFVGIVGGDFTANLDQLSVKHSIPVNFKYHMFVLLVHLCSIFIKSFITALAVYQLSQNLKQTLPSCNTDYSCYNFNLYFHQYEFLAEWMKLDPFSRGVAKYQDILYKSHLFMPHFSITKIPYKSLNSRVQNFKKLQMPIYEMEISELVEQNSQPETKKQFVILFYDFLYAFTKLANREMNSVRLTNINKCFVLNQAAFARPVSIMDIKNEGRASKLVQAIQDMKDVYGEFSENLKKQTYAKTREHMKERAQENSAINTIEVQLRNTRYTSQNLYYAHRIRNNINRFIKQVRRNNQLKKTDKANN